MRPIPECYVCGTKQDLKPRDAPRSPTFCVEHAPVRIATLGTVDEQRLTTLLYNALTTANTATFTFPSDPSEPEPPEDK